MTHQFADDADIDRLARAFLALSLPKAQWTHPAHFAVALWLLRHEPEPGPRVRMPGLIRAYNESVGGVNSETEGYHETITQASLRAAASMLAVYPDAPLHLVLKDLMAADFGRPDWVLAYWSRARLFSVEARLGWVEPDLRPLPF